MTKILVLSETFSAAHLYHQKSWSAEQNTACFGKCFTEHGHGHNYRFEVGIEAPKAPRTTLQANVKSVTDLLDHQHLNFVIPEFKNTIPTTENMALYLLKKLQERSPAEKISYIKLFEMNDLWVEIRP